MRQPPSFARERRPIPSREFALLGATHFRGASPAARTRRAARRHHKEIDHDEPQDSDAISLLGRCLPGHAGSSCVRRFRRCRHAAGDQPASGHPGVRGPAATAPGPAATSWRPAGWLPIDTAQTYRGCPSLRFEVRGPSQWWWTSHPRRARTGCRYSVEHYRSGGYLEFNVKGAAGGEQFTFGLGDVDNARGPRTSRTSGSAARTTLTVTTEWQHVKIALASADPGLEAVPLGTFKPRQLQSVRFREIYSGPYAKTFWLNDIKFTSPDREPSAPAVRVNEVGYLPARREVRLRRRLPGSAHRGRRARASRCAAPTTTRSRTRER